jgi:hypothetical protein
MSSKNIEVSTRGAEVTATREKPTGQVTNTRNKDKGGGALLSSSQEIGTSCRTRRMGIEHAGLKCANDRRVPCSYQV